MLTSGGLGVGRGSYLINFTTEINQKDIYNLTMNTAANIKNK